MLSHLTCLTSAIAKKQGLLLHGTPCGCAPTLPRRQLERLQGTVSSSAAQLKQLTADLAARDSEVAALREEVQTTRRRLHALQVGWGLVGLTVLSGGESIKFGSACPFARDVWNSATACSICFACNACFDRRLKPRRPPKTWWRWRLRAQGCRLTSRRQGCWIWFWWSKLSLSRTVCRAAALCIIGPGTPTYLMPTPARCLQALAVDYARSHLRSELAWTKAKLVVLAHMASGLRAKLAQAQTERAQAGEVPSGVQAGRE